MATLSSLLHAACNAEQRLAIVLCNILLWSDMTCVRSVVYCYYYTFYVQVRILHDIGSLSSALDLKLGNQRVVIFVIECI